MQKAPLDLFAQYKKEYAATARPRLLDVEPGWFLVIDGRGRPGEEEFQLALKALYTVAYGLKSHEKACGRDFKVPKLEGLWSLEPGYTDYGAAPDWTISWTLCLRMPDTIGENCLDPVAQALLAKGKPQEVKRVGLMGFEEGRCVQMLHVGPYGAQKPTLEAMQAFMDAHGLTVVGRHHEIYLNDPSRTAPGKLRTIIRLPVI